MADITDSIVDSINKSLNKGLDLIFYRLIPAILVVVIVVTVFITKQCTKTAPQELGNVIYNRVSSDNWGTSSDRDTIKEEYRVELTRDRLTITELVPGSVFFKHFVRDSTISSITFEVQNGSFTSGEYWGFLPEANIRLKGFDLPVRHAHVQGHEGIVRVLLYLGDSAGAEIYYFWPSNTR